MKNRIALLFLVLLALFVSNLVLLPMGSSQIEDTHLQQIVGGVEPTPEPDPNDPDPNPEPGGGTWGCQLWDWYELNDGTVIIYWKTC